MRPLLLENIVGMYSSAGWGGLTPDNPAKSQRTTANKDIS